MPLLAVSFNFDGFIDAKHSNYSLQSTFFLLLRSTQKRMKHFFCFRLKLIFAFLYGMFFQPKVTSLYMAGDRPSRCQRF